MSYFFRKVSVSQDLLSVAIESNAKKRKLDSSSTDLSLPCTRSWDPTSTGDDMEVKKNQSSVVAAEFYL